MAARVVLADGTPLPLAAGQRVGLTVQANDILKPQSVQADFSTTLTLADTPEVRAALEQAQQGMSLSEVPYAQVPCVLEDASREVLPGAVAIIEQHTTGKGFEAQVLGGNKNFYAALDDKKLTDLTFPASTEHVWGLPAVTAGAGHTSWQQGYVYDVYDKGKGASSSVHLFNDNLLPSVYSRAVFEQIIEESGFKWNGPMPDLFNQLLHPTPSHPGYSEAFRNARKLLAGLSGNNATGEQRAYEGRPDVRVTVPFDYTDGRYGYQAPSQPLVWNPVTHTWRALEPCFVSVTATTNARLRSPYGYVKARVSIWQGNTMLVDGPPVESKKNDGDSGFYRTYAVSATLTRHLLQAGQELRVEIHLNGERNSVGLKRWGYELFTGSIYSQDGVTLPLDEFRVEVLPDFPPGGTVRLADLLPAMSQKDYVKGLIGLFGLTQQTDPYTRRLTFTPTGPALAANLATAPDWQPLIDSNQPAPRLFHLPGTAQRNWFRWKEDDANPASAEFLGDGFLACPDTTLEPQRDVLTLPWAATAPGAGGLLLVPVFKARTGSVAVELEYDTLKPAPRLVVQTAATRSIEVVITHAEQQNGQTVQVTGPRERITISPRATTFAGLDFQRDLLPVYYSHLAAVYRRPLILKPSVRLGADAVADFSQLVPVWLEREGAYFYCNKIDQWEEGEPSTNVDLLRLTY